MPEHEPISVRGGTGGIEAQTEDMVLLADRYGSAGRDTGAQAIALHRYLVHPAVIAAAALDPVGAADFSGELLAALDGPRGLSWRAVEFELLGLRLRAAAAAYRGADALDQRFAPFVSGLTDAAPALTNALHPLVRGDVDGALRALAGRDPELIDVGVNAVTGFWTNYQLISTVAAYPDGRAMVTATGTDPRGAQPPRDLRSVLDGLARRNEGHGGDIDVRMIIGADGRRRVIVDIPGTKNWSPLPGETDVTGGGTNLRALTGARTTYQEGVLEAMRRAGVRTGDPVLLVGHSQGGMVAVATASQAARTGEFRITHVITAGAPIARLPVPRSVQVLAIENEGDVVPHGDGASNPDRTNVTTVTIHRGHSGSDDHHSLRSAYSPGAGDISASADPSVRDYLRGLRPFLSGTAAETRVFHVQRR